MFIEGSVELFLLCLAFSDLRVDEFDKLSVAVLDENVFDWRRGWFTGPGRLPGAGSHDRRNTLDERLRRSCRFRRTVPGSVISWCGWLIAVFW
ncbi:hypothetical protein [Tamaricihabitans halophyticus]|uniref:hypothetical protein n=1 Tax=Tamaricihabitans halophyticus TaxID=1262583 RepID=UPI0010446735|nr:hypothetical protein [Tamaricihabitans halophyticus]